MSLAASLQVARSGLTSVSEELALVSRNVANANNPDATAKLGRLSAGLNGETQIDAIDRTANEVLLEAALSANSAAQRASTMTTALTSLSKPIADPTQGQSPAALIGKLGEALQAYANSPATQAAGTTVVTAARRLAESLNSGAAAVQSVRQKADSDIATTVDTLNREMQQFQALNSQIVRGTLAKSDVTGQLDQRDALLKKISSDIGVRSVSRQNNDMALYTDSGITLFETTARSITFDRTTLGAGTTGAPIKIDGVPAAGVGETMPITSGRLRALVDIRDHVAPTYQMQLDEIARGLVAAGSESDQTSAGLPKMPGLFTSTAATTATPAGAPIAGLAAQLMINPSVDPDAGGNPSLIRDGGASGGAAYVVNPSGAPGFSARLQALADALSAPQSFSTRMALETSNSVQGLATASSSWLGTELQSATQESDFRSTVYSRTTEALSSDTGVNLDQEMSHMLELERAYQASSHMITTIDGMMRTLLGAVGATV